MFGNISPRDYPASPLTESIVKCERLLRGAQAATGAVKRTHNISSKSHVVHLVEGRDVMIYPEIGHRDRKAKGHKEAEHFTPRNQQKAWWGDEKSATESACVRRPECPTSEVLLISSICISVRWQKTHLKKKKRN